VYGCNFHIRVACPLWFRKTGQSCPVFLTLFC
jgi:hypothetical protein